jgi:hypothetical protein
MPFPIIIIDWIILIILGEEYKLYTRQQNTKTGINPIFQGSLDGKSVHYEASTYTGNQSYIHALSMIDICESNDEFSSKLYTL